MVHEGPSKLVFYHKREGTYRIGESETDHARYHKRERSTCHTCPHWWSALSKGTRAVARHECIHSMLLLDSDDGTDLTSGPYVLLILSIYFVNIVMILRFN